MQIVCRKCSHEIRAENINIDRLIAKCSNCNAVFSFQDEFNEASVDHKMDLTDMPVPEGMVVKHEFDHLLIERKWPKTVGIGIGSFALIWNLMIWIGFVPAAISDGFFFFGIMLTPFVLIGFGLAYVGLANLLNTTSLRVDSKTLTVDHAPIPYKKLKIDAQEITQLYTRENIFRGKSSTSVTYEVLAIKTDNKETSLMRGLDRPELALYIEKEIETFLSIHDAPVPGEFRP